MIDKLRWPYYGGYFLVTPKDSDGKDTIGGIMMRFPADVSERERDLTYDRYRAQLNNIDDRFAHALELQDPPEFEGVYSTYRYRFVMQGYYEFVKDDSFFKKGEP